jgi:hypothetical protein
LRRWLKPQKGSQPQQPQPPASGGGTPNQGEVYAQFVAAELEHERKRRERLETRATATIAASAALVGLAVAVGIFDPVSLSKQRPAVLGGVFLLGAVLILVSAVLAIWAGWLHGYKVADIEDVDKLLSADHWGESQVTARGRVAWFNARTLDTIRSGNNKKSRKLAISHGLQLAGVLLLLAVALTATVRSLV